MATLVRSQLNPLADTFIPSNIFQHKRVTELKSENDYSSKTVQQSGKQHLNDCDTQYKISKDIMDDKTSMTCENSDVMDKNSLLENHLSFHLPIVEYFKDYKEPVQKLNVDKNLCYPENLYLLKSEYSTECKGSAQKSNDKFLIQNPYVPELGCSTDDQKLVQKSLGQVLHKQNSHLHSRKRPEDNCKELAKDSAGMTPKHNVKGCTCPQMFGWTVPPDFIGNPFNFKYECTKKYPHSPDVNRWTFDQFRRKMKDIFAEVIDTISVDLNPISESGEEYKLKIHLEVCDTAEMNDTKRNESVEQNYIQSDTKIQCTQVSNMETNYDQSTEQVTNKSTGLDLKSTSNVNRKLYMAAVPELIDDGNHPLLQSKLINEEDEKNLVEKAEKILERNLSPHQSFDHSSGLDCSEVPCTPWCNHVPSPVKKAYNEYHRQKTENAKKFNEHCRQQQSVVHKPEFIRSLSADDSPLYSSLDETSGVDSRDMLLLRAKYPLLYLKLQSSNKRKRGSCDLTEQRLHYDNAQSGLWGKIEGADSLWQPLPECKPEIVFNHQPSLHERGHDRSRSAKRQRTLS